MPNASLHITGDGPGYLSSQLLPPLELDLIQELLQRTVGLPGRAHAAHSLFLRPIRLNVRLTRFFGCYHLHFSIYIFFYIMVSALVSSW